MIPIGLFFKVATSGARALSDAPTCAMKDEVGRMNVNLPRESQ